MKTFVLVTLETQDQEKKDYEAGDLFVTVLSRSHVLRPGLPTGAEMRGHSRNYDDYGRTSMTSQWSVVIALLLSLASFVSSHLLVLFDAGHILEHFLAFTFCTPFPPSHCLSSKLTLDSLTRDRRCCRREARSGESRGERR